MSVRREINLTTTGTLSPVIFEDLGERSFTHPITDFNLLEEYSHDKLTKSGDLQNAIDNGHIVVRDENNVVLNSIELLNILNNFEPASPTVNDDASAGYSIGSNWVNTNNNNLYICVDNTIDNAIWIQPVTVAPSCVQFGRNFTITNSYLQGAGGTWTNQSPYVLPYDATLIAISSATRDSETWTAEVRMGGVLVPGASLFTVTATSNYVDGLDIDFSAGDKIQVYANGVAISRPNVSLFFVRR